MKKSRVISVRVEYDVEVWDESELFEAGSVLCYDDGLEVTVVKSVDGVE